MNPRNGARRGRLSVLLILLFLLTGGVWNWLQPLGEPAHVEPLQPVAVSGSHASRPVVEVAPVVRKSLPIQRQATGYLEAEHRIELAMDVAGRVVESFVEEGAKVAAGELLLRLDARDRELEVEEAKAEWLKMRAQYAIQYETGNRPARSGLGSGTETGDSASGAGSEAGGGESQTEAERLYAQGLISKQEAASRRRAHEAADFFSGARQQEVRESMSGLMQAEQRLARAKLALERTELFAPFGGRIANVQVEVGQVLSAGQVVLELLGNESLKVDVNVLAADMVRMRPGAPARVRVPSLDGRVMEGTVRTVNPLVDPETGMGRLTVALPNPGGRLMVGLFAYVDLETQRLEDRLVVPAEALLERQARELVFRIEGGRARWTYVTTGERSGDWVEIADGLQEGDQVAVAGHFALAHEAQVNVSP